MTVAAAVGSVLPGVAAPEAPPIVEKPPIAEAVAVAPSLKGKCARAGQTRTVKGVRYVCGSSRRWQKASTGTSGGASAAVTTTSSTTTVTTTPSTSTTSTTVRASTVTGKLQGWEWTSSSPSCVEAGENITLIGSGFSPSLGLPAAWFSAGVSSDSGRPTESRVVRAESTVASTTQIRVKVPERSQIPSGASASDVTLHLTGGALEDTSVSWGSGSFRWCSTSGGSGTGGSTTTTVRGTTGTTTTTIKPGLPRSTVDRPGSGIWDIKVVYATLMDGPDESRDSNGQLAYVAERISEYFAKQRPGYELRFDRFGGSIDVQHVKLPVTAAEFRAKFQREGQGWEIQKFIQASMAAAGLRFSWTGEDGSNRYGLERRMYLLFLEGPRGLKQGAEYQCGRVSELEAGALLTAVNLRNNAGAECDKVVEFESDPANKWWRMAWDAMRFIGHALLELPECHSVRAAEIAASVELRLENRLPSNDVLSNSWGHPPFAAEPVMDPNGAYYLNIRSGPYVSDRCRDIKFSPFWAKDPRWHAPPLRETNSGERTRIDRPDDSTEPQAKVFYVLPKGATDRQIDLKLSNMNKSANEWLRSQTGRTLRWDTHQNVLDVMFVELDQTEEELWTNETASTSCAEVPCPTPDYLLGQLQARGLIAAHKLAVILYEGSASPVNPRLGGCYAGPSMVVAYQMCISSPIETPSSAVPAEGTLGIRILHEIFHTLGAVGEGAPNGDGGLGHIKGDSNDIMAVGSRTGWEVDPGRDDYWGHGKTGFVDLNRSIFLNDPVAGAEYPSRWRR